jgi:hypothetical protein
VISTLFLLVAKSACCIVKLYFLYKQYVLGRSVPNKTRNLLFLLGMFLFCNAFCDFSWIVKLSDKLLYPSTVNLLTKITQEILRLSWITSIIGYFSLGLFLERLSNKRFQFRLWHWVFIIFNLLIIGTILAICITSFHITDPAERVFELWIYRFSLWYYPLALVPSIVQTLYNIKTIELPHILKKQIKLLIMYLLVPHVLLMLGMFNPSSLGGPFRALISVDRYIFIAINDVIYLIMLHFCTKRILCLRFLNTTKHVQATVKYNFADHFKDVLLRLGQVISLKGLEHITTQFFAQAFELAPENTALYIRARREDPTTDVSLQVLPRMEEWLLTPQYKSLLDEMATSRILIRDELDFDYFYDEDPHQKAFLTLLDVVDADIVVPIYERQAVIAYIIVKKGSRPEKLFSDVERDEMCIFASYLSAIVYLLQHRNLSELIRQEHAWQEDLYIKQQEINHYKESIRTILKASAHRMIGVIQYQRRRLTWLNDTARNLFGLEKNASIDSIMQGPQLKQIAQDAMRYSIERPLVIQDMQHRSLHCLALPYGDGSQSMILVYRADIADTFTIPFDRLKDVASWEYALYLETTESGKLINQLIPSSSEAFLNFKIDLLKISLSKKATLLELPEDDLSSIVHIIHHISLRSKLQICHLTKPERAHEIGVQMFGVEPVLETDIREGWLSVLHDVGTLFIQNVEFLSMETQQRLASCLATGMFQPFKNDKWRRANVRIICSTLSNLALLVSQNKFSAELYSELCVTAIALPSLINIPRHEIADLAHQVTEQTIQSQELRSLIGLNMREADTIIDQVPTSIHALKERVREALKSKSHRQRVDHVIKFEPTSSEMRPEIAHAIRLGKRALKDQRLMNILWDTFQSQAKIATLLNVNRSSVNRRCKEFNLPSEKANS